ncbi:MAG: hypothetical protein CMK92_02145 [Pseudomonas sp.]|nr:hypothetical protein [Pseudomonas sp.]|tara:strand:+ start:248 stop:685 length:438 start_codon:yes stop_codon:yes gene_type:complete
MASKSNDSTPNVNPELIKQIQANVERMEKKLKAYGISHAVQQEALKVFTESCKSAALVSKAHLDSITKSAEARAQFMCEALKHAVTPEERQKIYDDFIQFNISEMEERSKASENAHGTIRTVVKVAGTVLLAAVGAYAYANNNDK